MEGSEQNLAITIIGAFIIFSIILIKYIDGKMRKKQNKDLEENMNKHITRTGALENDRLNERQ